MAGSNRIDESLVVPGSSALAVLERVRIAMRDVEGYTVAPLAGDGVQLVWSGRKLLRQVTTSCAVRVAAGPQGLVVALQGELEAAHLELVRGAVLGRSREQMQIDCVDTFQPPPAPPGATTGFTPPSDWFVGAGSAGIAPPPAPSATLTPTPPPNASFAPTNATFIPTPPPVADPHGADPGHTVIRARSTPNPHPLQPSRTLVLYTPDGRATPVAGLTLIGRSPSTRPEDPPATAVVAVNDPAMSKTHLWLGRDGDQIWVEDRHSGNGTSMIGPGGEVELPAGQRTALTIPATLVAGDSTLSLAWGA